MKRTSGQRECSVELRLKLRRRQSGKEAKRPLCDRKLTSKAELKDFPPHHPTKFWWIIKYGQCKEEAAAEDTKLRKRRKKVALMKPPSMAGGKFAQRCSCSSRERGRRQGAAAACGLPEWALKWTPQWMCAAWQIRKVSFEIKQHLLPILNYISDKLCPRPCLNSYSTSFSYFCCRCCRCCFFYFFLVFFRASPCSSSFSLALAALTDLTAQHQLSTLNSQLSFWLSALLEAKPGACSFQTFDTETNFGKRVLPTEPTQSASQPAGNSQQPTVVAACSFLLLLSFYVPLPLSVSLSRCAFSGFSFFCWLQYFIAFAVRVLHTFERRWGLP